MSLGREMVIPACALGAMPSSGATPVRSETGRSWIANLLLASLHVAPKLDRLFLYWVKNTTNAEIHR